MARALTAAERVNWNAMQVRAQEAAPYLTSALLSMQPVADDGLGTFAVDAHWRVYIDPDRFDVWTPEEQAGVLLHEVGHLLREHHQRAAAHGVTRHTVWNLAADSSINRDLHESNVRLPEGAITPASLGVDEGLTSEAVYDLIVERGDGDTSGSGESGDGDTGDGEAWDGGCGSGAGGMAAPGELAVGDPLAEGIDDGDAELLRRKVAEDIRQFGGKGRGTAPGNWRRWADTTLAPTPIPWQRILTAAINRTATLIAGRLDTSYRRRSSRRIPGVVLPGNVRPKPSMATVIDTSGSMSSLQVRVALEQIHGIIRRCGLRGREHLVITVDAKTHGEPQPVTDATKIRMAGGGGTDMRVGIAKIAALRNGPKMCLVLTDGETPWPTQRPANGLRLIIGLIGDAQRIAEAETRCPEWATVVPIPIDKNGVDLPAAA